MEDDQSPSGVRHQVAGLVYRVRKGKLEVLLITSRETSRWILPKGNIKRNSTPADSAMAEVFEEAGVKVTIDGSTPFGFFTYSKRLPSDESQSVSVEVYLCRAKKLTEDFPEKGQRSIRWHGIKKALSVIQEPGVVPLLARLAEIEGDLVLRR
jgi:8-oxo-dGTP pyrophosphatase MutT (NUDIX family)